MKIMGILQFHHLYFQNTVLFASKCFENYKQYERKKIIALEKSQQKMNSKKKVVSIKDALKNEFKMINNEITWFLTENANELHTGLIIDLANSQIVKDHLKQEIDSITEYRQESIFKWEQLKHIPDLPNKKRRLPILLYSSRSTHNYGKYSTN